MRGLSRLGIGGFLLTVLCALLTAAGAIAALLVSQLVGAESESAVLDQQRLSVEQTARLLSRACRAPEGCDAAQAAVGERTNQVIYGPGMQVLAGRSSGAPPASVIDALQSGHTNAYVESGPNGRHEIAVLYQGAAGRAVLSAQFDLGPLRSAVGEKQRLVGGLLIADLFLVLLFALYLSSRYIVSPIRRLTRAAESAAAGAQIPAIKGPQELARLSVAFAEMVDRLSAVQSQVVRSEKLATVGRLAAGLAHEVGNPLAAVLGFVEFLRDDRGVDPKTQADLLARMDVELNRIRGTLRELLDFSRTAPAICEPTHLETAAQAALELVRYQDIMRGVTVTISGSSQVLEGTPGRLRQIMVNLMLNAAQAMGGEGKISVAISDAPGEVIARVEDTGPGVPETIVDGLFDPFVTTKPVGEGTGLGLAVCQRIAVEMGGSLTLDRSVTTGACFELRLPVVRPELPPSITRPPG